MARRVNGLTEIRRQLDRKRREFLLRKGKAGAGRIRSECAMLHKRIREIEQGRRQ